MSLDLREKRCREILGKDAEQIMNGFREISPDFAEYIMQIIFGDLYQREGLTDKDRELAVVANLIGQGKTEFPLRVHIGGMLNVGWTEQEVIESLILLIGYVGFPSIVEAMKTAQEVFSARKETSIL